jgi:hypothetical protein
MSSRNIAFVIGMHRSGTSVVARAVIALGATFGETLIPPSEYNPLGFFEDLDIVSCNRRILDLYTGDSEYALTISPGIDAKSAFEYSSRTVPKLIQSKFISANITGCKDHAFA